VSTTPEIVFVLIGLSKTAAILLVLGVFFPMFLCAVRRVATIWAFVADMTANVMV